MTLIDADKYFNLIVNAKSAMQCIEKLHSMPAVDAVPVRHGHWIDKFGGEYRCSSCRKIVCIDDEVEFPNGISYDYCPYCGSKMNEEADKCPD